MEFNFYEDNSYEYIMQLYRNNQVYIRIIKPGQMNFHTSRIFVIFEDTITHRKKIDWQSGIFNLFTDFSKRYFIVPSDKCKNYFDKIINNLAFV